MHPDDGTDPYSVGSQLQVPQTRQPLQALNSLYLVLHEVQVFELPQMVYSFDMLDFVEAEI